MLQSFCDLRGSNCEAVVTLKRDNQRMVKRLCDVWTPRLSMPKYNTSSHFSPPKKPFHHVFGSLMILSSRYTYHTFRPSFFFQKLPLKRSLGNQVFPVSKIAVSWCRRRSCANLRVVNNPWPRFPSLQDLLLQAFGGRFFEGFFWTVFSDEL